VEFHPIANIFPMMSDEELSELAESIESNGLRVPILLYEGKILDGRNRYQACESSGVKPEYTEFEGDDPLSHVLDLNLHRRHLTSGQKAIVVAEAQTVGSAVVEKAVDLLVCRRQKLRGQNWSRTGADRLRCWRQMILNHQWDDYWQLPKAA